MEHTKAQPQGRVRLVWVREERSHKFRAGDNVRMIARAGDIRPKDIALELAGARFEVARLLPADRGVFQYRIRDKVTDRERVATEDEIEHDAS